MTWLLWGKLLSVIGGLITLVPALHVLYETRKAARYKPRKNVGTGVKELLSATRQYLVEAIPVAHCNWHLQVTILGIAIVIVGFAIDFSCEAKWMPNCGQ